MQTEPETTRVAQYGCHMQIRRDAITQNLATLRDKVTCRMMAVLKNDGYGLTLPQYARLLADGGITAFAVGSLEEAAMLRENGINGDVLLLTPQTSPEAILAMAALDVCVTVGSLSQAQAVLQAAPQAPVHIMIDTGLGRYGFTPQEVCEAADTLRQLHIVGTYTHFAAPYRQRVRTARQFRTFVLAVQALRGLGVEPGLLHCCASGAMLRYPHMHLDMVRVGSALLGRVPKARDYGLRPAVALVAPLTAVKQTGRRSRAGYNGGVVLRRKAVIGIVGAGTAHGYLPRRRFFGLLKAVEYADLAGKKVRMLGALGTNSLAIDLTGINCREGDMVSIGINPLHCAAGIPRVFI